MSYTILKSVSINKDGVVKFSGYTNNVSPRIVESWEWIGAGNYEDNLLSVFDMLVGREIQPMASCNSKIVYAFYQSLDVLSQHNLHLMDLWGEREEVRQEMFEAFKEALNDDIKLTKKDYVCTVGDGYYVQSKTTYGYKYGSRPKLLTFNMAFDYASHSNGKVEKALETVS